MIQTIVTYLNARLASLGRIDRTYCLTERRKREGDAVATIPYEYTGAGEFQAVDIDNGSSSWWRGRSGFTLEPVNVVGRAVKQQQGSYPLRVVVLLRRKDSVADDAFMPSRLAEDVANVLNFDNGDLQTMLGAWSVSSRTSGGEYDSTRVWVEEFQTPVPDLDYRLCMVAVDVTVDVVADYKCWQNECSTDPDILRLFNFCDPSVAARLTPEQVECLQAAFPTPCEDATAQLNGVTVGTIPSGGQQSFPVLQNGNPVGAWNGTEWVIPTCAPATWDLEDEDGNPLNSGSIPSGGSAVIVAPSATVLRDGLPYDTVLSGGSIDVPSDCPPCADGSVGINGNAGLFTVASGGAINIMVEDSDGNPKGAFDPDTNSWVIPDCPPIPTIRRADVTRYLDAIGIPDDGTMTVHGITGAEVWDEMETFAAALEAIGTGKIPAIYPFIGGLSTTHWANFYNPMDSNAAFRLTFHGGVTHDATGITGNGVNGYAQTYFVVNGLLGQNATGITWYCRNVLPTAPTDKFPMGAYGAGGIGLGVDYFNTLAYVFNNDSTFSSHPHSSDGIVSVNRTVNTTKDLWKNGTKIAAINVNTNGMPTNRIGILAVGTPAYFTTANIATAVIHEGMSDADMTAIHAAIAAFNTALGR